jgi:L-alanine-DL-glutamate epimerase-like enolase superfamily enzyme
MNRAPTGATALAAGIETALLDAVARRAGVPLARWLDSGAADRVPVNALVSARQPDRAAAEAAAAVAHGFATVKLKVGTARSTAAEVERVAAVRSALGPGPRLRLDANGAWGEEEAVALLRRLERFDLELVEQPVAADDLAALARVRRSVGVAVAADEAVTGVDAARRVVAAGAADVLVVKPMVVGGLGPAREVAAVARAAGLGVVVTTTVDAGVGTAAALHLAASLGESRMAHGLATAGLLESDLLVEEIGVCGGVMAVPGGEGLGVGVDWGAVERHRVRGEK